VIVFPSSEPGAASGPGALLWSALGGCGAPAARSSPASAGTAATHVTATAHGAAAAGGALAAGAQLAADDRPGRGRPLSAVAGLATVAVAAGTAEGQVVAVGAGSGVAGVRAPSAPGVGATADGATEAGGAEAVAPSAPGVGATAGGAAAAVGPGALAEGRAVGSFSSARPLGGPAGPVAAASGYLGDVVVVSPVETPRTGWALAVRLQRHYSSALAAPHRVSVGAGPVEAVAATMDYRAEVLLVWAAHARAYARAMSPSGVAGPLLTLGSVAADPEVQALLSDDGHAIVAWRSRSPAPGGGSRTAIELSRFEVAPGAPAPPAPTVVERFRDPSGSSPPPGVLRLVRLSSEAVMMAWTGLVAGRYVVRASPVSLRRGAWAPVTISGGSGWDATLADLVSGPRAEALALWSADPRRPGGGGVRPGRAASQGALFAARGHYAGHGEVSFETPEEVAPPGSYGPPAAAIDPRTGWAVAAWITRPPRAPSGRVVYALRAPGPASLSHLTAGAAQGATGPALPPRLTVAAAQGGHRTRATAGQEGRRTPAGSGSALVPALLAALLLLFVAVLVLRVGTRLPGRMRAPRG
jgi:hypothetical protein